MSRWPPAIYYPKPDLKKVEVIQSTVLLTVAGKPWNRETKIFLEKGGEHGVNDVYSHRAQSEPSK